MVVAHLYSDLLNLYGNDGNIKILVKKLREIGVSVDLVSLSVGDKFNFSKYDLVYIGSGTEKNQEIALNDLMIYKDDIMKFIDDDKVFLVTGNALDLFGNGFSDRKDVKCLELFDFSSLLVERIRKDVIYDCSFLGKSILGFENHNYVIDSKKCDSLFDDEGVRKNNLMGTYVEGPILVRNPYFLKYIIELLVKDEKKLKKLDLSLEIKAYDNFYNLLTNGYKQSK